MGGFAFALGNFQNNALLAQEPLVGPMPSIPGQVSVDGTFEPGMTPRSLFSDPFMVLENRETMVGEVLLSYDQTPGTWMWYWTMTSKKMQNSQDMSVYATFISRPPEMQRLALMSMARCLPFRTICRRSLGSDFANDFQYRWW